MKRLIEALTTGDHIPPDEAFGFPGAKLSKSDIRALVGLYDTARVMDDPKSTESRLAGGPWRDSLNKHRDGGVSIDSTGETSAAKWRALAKRRLADVQGGTVTLPRYVRQWVYTRMRRQDLLKLL